MTDDRIETKLYYCRPCTLHGRATVREAAEAPTLPCPFFGEERDDCKRMEWVMRNYFCAGCQRIGKTSIAYAASNPNVLACSNGHTRRWVETDESNVATRDHVKRPAV